MDRISSERRSANMRAVASRNTRPEIIVRRLLHRLGYRYRLHQRDLPGSPDLVFAGRRLALFVHGCFWHSHPHCSKATIPASNTEFWRAKLDRNKRRDEQAQSALKVAGWRTGVVWECETRNTEDLRKLLIDIVEGAQTT